MRTLSDQGWEAICAAARRKLKPDVEAEVRAELSEILFKEYPALAYDRERVVKSRERAERMLESLDAFEAEHHAQFTQPDDIKTERDRYYLKKLRLRAEALWIAALILQHTNTGRRSAQREWLYARLCALWLEHFYGELTYDRSGGEPSGALVEFILAAMRQVMPENKLPKRETVRDAIDRERHYRERLRAFVRRGGRVGD